jgi:hypothetical protein
MREIEKIRELTDAELDSVTGGQGASAAGAGQFESGAGAALNPSNFHVVGPFGGTVNVGTATAAAGAFGD